MATGVYTVEIKWDGSTWTDESERCQDIHIVRGRADDLQVVEAGTCDLTLEDNDGRFNPANAASPLYPHVKPLRAVRVRATYDSVVYDLFAGYTRAGESDSGMETRRAQIECVDAFLLLHRVRPTIAAVATTTGGAIGLLLDAVGFPGGASRSLQIGDSITFSADGSATALGMIAGLLLAERGQFFISAGGVATYLDRHAQNRSPYTSSQATIADGMRAIAPGFDLEQVRNRATVTSEGGTPQAHEDAASVAEYNYSDYGPITSPYLGTDAKALSLAKYLVLKRKDGVPPVRYLDLENGDAATFEALLARELGDRITATDDASGTDGDYHILRIEHRIAGRDGARVHRCSWGLLRRDTAAQPFLIGISTIGGPDVITY